MPNGRLQMYAVLSVEKGDKYCCINGDDVCHYFNLI